MHLGAAINGGFQPDNEAAEDLHSILVLFSINRELLYNRSDPGLTVDA
jgi:hypothetical protein